MRIAGIVGLTASTIAAAVVATTAAHAQDCSWYARKALEQQRKNSDLRCGLQGPEWTRDLTAHLNWCKNVAPQEWQKQAQQRDLLLAKCPPPK